MRSNDLAALVLHVKAYRETSSMVQFFTQDLGRLVGVMKGLRRGRNPVQIQPFNFGSLSCFGRGSMVTVTQFDVQGRYALNGDALGAGFYVFELISRCLAEHQSEPGVFAAVHKVLTELDHGEQLAPCLRIFETALLTQLGYGADYQHEADSGTAIDPQGWYEKVADSGFMPSESGHPNAIPGWVLLSIERRDFSDIKVLRAAKMLNQQSLAPLLGSKPLLSRSLLSGATLTRQPKA